jgi:purine-binding chemotaxis protein CheW
VSMDDQKGSHIVQMAAIRVGDEDYVIDIMRIREIINPLKITPVHDETGLIEGVINLRGVIIPVVDLRKRLGLAVAEDANATKIVIAAVGARVVGFRVDGVLEVVRIPLSQIRPPPQLKDEHEPGLFLGVCQFEERLLLLLNLKKVLNPAFFQSFDGGDAPR